MILKFLTKLFGTKSERDIRTLTPYVDAINTLEPKMSAKTDYELREMTDKFKNRLADGETLDDILPEAFAVVREVAKRKVKMRHFDVQLIGGIVLYQGKISEMATGEGKTLVATLPAYLVALQGKGVHIVTVNDYLARRDREWMGPIYESLGLTVGVIQHDLEYEDRKKAYNADITYGTNNEFGFDYLRDNMSPLLEMCVQRGLYYAIVDEVDSILIDEARTPLIISGPAEASTDLYYKVNSIVPYLKKDTDFSIEEKDHIVCLTEEGASKAERLLNIDNMFTESNLQIIHHIQQALRAHYLYKKDEEYIVKDGQVVIVDEFTGRLMEGRRYSDGLHQALEAKEGVKIERENQTLATITFQNYFRLYEKLAGMTGTADTEAMEFKEIYKLDVIVIPTNKPLIRTNYPDIVYKTEREKFNAIVDEIVELNELGRPVLVGTVSIEKSERLSKMLKRKGIKHNVLNAKHHEKEAQIIAEAGQRGAVTIATNMAGRGTDIVLGEGIPNLGGLHVLGTERHESRRIDNQLRGRCGRQGDPGSSRFFLSLEDDLMRIFGSDKVKLLADRLGMQEGEALQHRLVTKAIETAQKRVESHNFDIRKHVLKYDNVMNDQRKIIYSMRQQLLQGIDPIDEVVNMAFNVLDRLLETHAPKKSHPDEWQIDELSVVLFEYFGLPKDILTEKKIYEFRKSEDLANYLYDIIKSKINDRKLSFGEEEFKDLCRTVMLRTIDAKWKEHLYTMDHLRDSIGLRAYGQKDPLVEYQREGFDLFDIMYSSVEQESMRLIFRIEIMSEEEARKRAASRKGFRVQNLQPQAPAVSANFSKPSTEHRTTKVGRNDPCPCGSGKKYKKCCGASV